MASLFDFSTARHLTFGVATALIFAAAQLVQPPLLSAAEAAPAVALEANPLPLTDVRLTGGPLKHAQELDANYLLQLDVDRMMAGYRVRAGLKPKAEGYGGWDAVESRQLTGHIAGHYLSAVSLMYAATADDRMKERADRVVLEMKEVQDANGDGYLGALLGTRPGAPPAGPGGPNGEDLVDGRELFRALSRGEIRSGGFDLNGMWSPWYTLHKTYAGLRDAYRFTGNKTALELEIKFAEWAEGVLGPLNDEQIQNMLRTEFGGMNEIFVDLYADTGDERWLKLSYKFEHESVIKPLSEGQDILAGTHANTQIPKLIGSLSRFILTGMEEDGAAARFFWDSVVDHHSFATGGNSKDEHFDQPDKLNNHIHGRTAESCNVYNMLKLTRMLFALKPDPKYAEFQERALFNHVLGSIDPQDGSTCYMVPVGQGVQREYADMMHSFTCCVGSGMESHALHGAGIYHAAKDQLWVSIYAPSRAEWREAGVTAELTTDFPMGDSAEIKLSLDEPKAFTLSLRRPLWADQGFTIAVNGEPVADLAEAGKFVDVSRTWRQGDTVTITMPKRLRLEPLPDNERRVAIMWGPLVLATELGDTSDSDRGRGRRRGRSRSQASAEAPAFLAVGQPIDAWLKPVGDAPGRFRSLDVGRPADVTLMPFFQLHRKPYAAHFDLFTPSEWDRQRNELANQRLRERRLARATVAFAQPGEMQPERDSNYQGDQMTPTRVDGRAGRVGKGWCSFEMAVDGAQPMALVATYHSGDWRRRIPAEFTISIDGTKVAEAVVEPSDPPRFFDAEYSIPVELIAGKDKVTVRFDAKPNCQVGPIFGLRTIRREVNDQVGVVKPPESFFEIVDERVRDRARAFYSKYLEVDGMPIVASAEVADEALERTRWIVTHMLAGRPDVVDALVERQMYLIIIGRNQLYCDMPEYADNPNPEYQNERVRGTGGRPTSFGEENVLSLPIDRYDDESIAVHEFCHTIDGILGAIDPTWNARKNAAYEHALNLGLYKFAYAASNAGEYWAEVGQAYFDCNRINNWNHGPIGGREQLKRYDPVGYELARTAFNLSPEQDWRYEYLQKHPVVIAPPGKFRIDPYYRKFSYARELPVVARSAADDAVLRANDVVRKMFAYRHDLLKAIINDGGKLVILAADESLADLPECKAIRDNGDVDLLTRSLDYSPQTKIMVVGQEDVLSTPGAPRRESLLVRLLANAIYDLTAGRPVDPEWNNRGRAVQQYELRVERLDERFGQKLNEIYRQAIEEEKWQGTSAVHNVRAYWAAGVLAYFDAVGGEAAPTDAAHPIATREDLRTYDAQLFELVNEVMAYAGHVDWRLPHSIARNAAR